MSPVTVLGDDMGSVLHISENNPKYSFVRVMQKNVVTYSRLGWERYSDRYAIIPGEFEKQQGRYHAGQELPGKLIVLEQLHPFSDGDYHGDIKIAGATGVVCRYYDQPIYRKVVYTEDMSRRDELIQHTNTDEIKEAQAAQASLRELIQAPTTLSQITL